MDHITKLYYNKVISLQEKYNSLSSIYKNLLEDISTMTDEQIEKWVSQNSQNPEQAAAQREMLKNRREKARQAKAKQKTEAPKAEPKAKPQPEPKAKPQPEPEPQAKAKPQPEPKAKPQPEPKAKPQPEAQPKAETKGTSAQGAKRAPMPGEPGFEEYIKQKAEEMRREAEAKKQAKPDASAKKPEPKPEQPKAKPEKPSAKPSTTPSGESKVAKVGKRFGKGLASFGAGWLGYDVGRAAAEKALDVAGVENQVARDIAGEAAGGAAGGIAATTTASALSGALPAAKALGVSALRGGLAGVVGYGAYKAGEAIADIEVDDKGTTVSDVSGKWIYDRFGQLTGQGTSSQQLNTAKTGVAGGEAAQVRKLEAEEEQEKKEKEEKAKQRNADIARRVEALKAQQAAGK